MIDLPRVLQKLRPGSTWSASDGTLATLTFLDGTTPPTQTEMEAQQQALDAAAATCANIRARLSTVLATFTTGQRIAYATAIDAVAEQLTLGEAAAALDIITTFPGVNESLRAQLIACF